MTYGQPAGGARRLTQRALVSWVGCVPTPSWAFITTELTLQLTEDPGSLRMGEGADRGPRLAQGEESDLGQPATYIVNLLYGKQYGRQQLLHRISKGKTETFIQKN